MNYFDNILNAIDSFSSKTFIGEDYIRIDVPEGTDNYIMKVLNVACDCLRKEQLKPAVFGFGSRNQIEMKKTNFNSINGNGSVSPLFIQELKKSARCFMVTLKLLK